MNKTRRRKGTARGIGLPPGELIPLTPDFEGAGYIKQIRYTEADFQEETVANFQTLPDHFPPNEVTFISVFLTQNVAWVRALGEKFRIPPLILEDIFDTDHRPKIEETSEYTFITLKRVVNTNAEPPFHLQQFSILFSEHLVVTFQDADTEELSILYDRLRCAKGRVRRMGADYLAYAIMDILVDHYYVALDRLNDRIDQIEAELSAQPGETVMRETDAVKRRLLQIRRAVWPLREVVGTLSRGGGELFTPEALPYLRDLYDHVVQIIDTVEIQRDMASGMLDVYFSSVSSRMNSIMKVLTIISTIFIPLNFLAGVYGMNFDYMPELKFHYGYFVILTIMLGVAGTMLYLFRRNKWF